MNDAQVDRILDDFRDWLRLVPPIPPAPTPAESLNLAALIAQFSALRHDVNMQTKAARAAVEQSNGVLRRLEDAERDSEQSDPESSRRFVQWIIEIHDVLGIAHRQMEKASRSAVDRSGEIAAPPEVARPGFLARLFGAETVRFVDASSDRKAFAEELARLRSQLSGAADGYAMTLRRIERAFAEFGIEPIRCLGEPFDPDRMEVVDTAATGVSGTVVDVVRNGYYWNNRLHRCAQVVVAK